MLKLLRSSTAVLMAPGDWVRLVLRGERVLGEEERRQRTAAIRA
jgi:hypothetical protein